MLNRSVITIGRYFFITLCTLISLAPIMPEISYQINKIVHKKDLIQNQTENSNTSIIKDDNIGTTNQNINVDETNTNRLIIKSIEINEEIFEGVGDGTLNLGLWHKPYSSMPSESKGNVVIAGHRFGYLSPATRVFYHLDKVKVGEEIVVIYGGTHYTYQVEQVYEVKPEQVEIENQSEVTDRRILTLYTCTPLWTAEKRLVVRAIFIN